MPTFRCHDRAPPLLVALPSLLLLVVVAMAPSAAAQTDASRDKDNGGGLGPAGRMTQPPGFSAPMAGLLVALIVAFFFIGFFSVYMRRCGREGPVIPAAALRALSRQQERNRQRGLDPAVVASFPTMRYAEARELRVVGGKDAALECAVCLSEFEDDEELRLLPSCSHAFHPDCIGEWLAGHVTCPVCRCNLDPADEVDAADTTTTSSSAGEVAVEQQQQDQVVIDVIREGVVNEEDEEKKRREAMELDRIGSQRRTVRNRSALPLPRSHSTGHSLAQRLDGDDLERFTLRLPEHVRREMVAESLRRTGHRDVPGAGVRSARLGRSDRWPSFIARTFSARVPFWAASRRATDAENVAAGTETARSKREKPAAAAATDGSVTNSRSVRFDCLGVGAVSGGARVSAAAGDSEAEEDEEKAIVVVVRQG